MCVCQDKRRPGQVYTASSTMGGGGVMDDAEPCCAFLALPLYGAAL